MPQQHHQAPDEDERWRQFGEDLRGLRHQRGYRTQRTLAQETGIAESNLALLERGGYRKTEGGPWLVPNPRDETLIALARVLKADVEAWFKRLGRYSERARTTRDLRRASGRQARVDRLAALEQETAALRERLDQLERLLRDAGIGVPKPRRRG